MNNPVKSREFPARFGVRRPPIRTNRRALEHERDLRQLAEAAQTETNEELVAELAGMTRLHELSTRLLAETELEPLLQETLAAVMALQQSDLGSIQLYDPATRALRIVAHSGFAQDFLDLFGRCNDESTIDGRSLLQRERVIVEDVLVDALFSPHLAIAQAAGYRAVQSTPLFSRGGLPLGVISTYFRRPHRPSDRDLRFTDFYARHAADLIERRQSEMALRASEEKYRTLFDSIDEGFCTVEVLFDDRQKAIDFRFLEVNPSFEKQTGVQNARGKTARAIAPRLEEHWFETFGRIALSGEPARFENPAAELRRWYDVYAFRIGDPRERKVAVLFNDITERKNVLQALRASEERFRRYFDLGLVGMAMTSPGKGCLEVNDELCRILGYDRRELLQKRWTDMTHPDDLAADVAQFNRVVSGEIDGYTLDKRWIRKDGRVIDSVMAAQCVRRIDGSVDYFVGLVLDTTERKRGEENLHRSEHRFRELIEAIPHHVWSVRPDGSVGYWNQQLADYTGLTALQLRQGGWEALHPDDVPRVKAAWQQALATGDEYEMEQRVRGRDGCYRRFVRRGVAARDEQGRLREWLGTDTDVEEARAAEEALHKAQSELAHVMRVTTMGELAASIAHEVNQPLAAIVANGSACARWLAAEPPNLNEVHGAVARVIQDANRASGVVTRIRAFLRREEFRTLLDINDVIREVVDQTQSEVRSHAVTLHVGLATGLPRVVADRIQLQQVTLNLILNAVEAMEAVLAQTRVLDIGTRAGEGTVVVAVRDSGAGLDPAHRDQIFDAFHTTKPGGMGMGLAIARSIVESHGGRLWATANSAGGETFQFTVPVTAPIAL